MDWTNIKYFHPHEFDDPLYPGSGESIDGELVYDMDCLRGKVACPIITHAKVGGAVDVSGKHGHSSNSFHLQWNGSKALDFHFKTNADPRTQYLWVEEMGFTGIGVYYCWHWDGKLLPIAFHVDLRPVDRIQRWVCRERGEYNFLLGR